MTAQENRIDREEVYSVMKRLIEESPTGEREISSSYLSDLMGGQAPSLDYHMRRLVDEGRVVLLDRRGKYNRKIYKLPSESDVELVYNQDELDHFKDILKKKMESKGIASSTDEELNDVLDLEDNEEQPAETKVETIDSEDPSTEEIEDIETDETSDPDDLFNQPTEEEESEEPANEVNEESIEPIQELSLDQRIENFLKQSQNVPDPERLLTLQDTEILSVMHETIQQNMIYLKDLSEQLSTVENKQLIKSLIDERNQYLQEKEQLLKEREELREQLVEKTGKFDLDPQRIRMIQQNLINVLDTYLDQPNHTLALARREFRNTMTQHISDAFRYILNLEK